MGAIIKKLIFCSLILFFCGSTATANSTEIRANITAVRIIVVNDQDRITAIYQNADQVLTPEVRRNKPDGPIVTYTPIIAQQYQAYSQQLPSLIEALYAML